MMVKTVVPIAAFNPDVSEKSSKPGTNMGPALIPKAPEMNPEIIPKIIIKKIFIL